MKADLIVASANRIVAVMRANHVDSALARQLDCVEWAEYGNQARVLVSSGIKQTVIAILAADERGRAA